MGNDFNDFAQGKSDEELRSEFDGATGHKPNGAGQTKSRTMFWPELAKLARPKYLVKGFLSCGDFGEFYGPSGSCKSFIAADLALHVALGWKWFGRKVRQGGVLYVSAEGGSAIINRLAAFAQHHQIQLDEVPFGVVLAPTNLLDPGGIDQVLADAALVSNLKLIIIDTAARVMPGGKEDTEAMGKFVAACDHLRAATGAAVLAVHHSGKEVGRGSRGSTVLPAAVDLATCFSYDKTKKSGIADILKVRDGMSGDKFQFELLTVHLGVDEDGDPITSCIIKEGEPITEQTQSLTGAAKIALDILKRAIIDAGEDPPSSPHIPPGVRAINTDLWREYCYSGTVTESDDAEAKRKAFGRASKRLQELKKIGTWNGWVWPV